MARSDTFLLGIDVGTSSCKATILAARGQLVAEVGRGYPTRRTSAGEVSQDPADWLRAVRSAVHEVVTQVDRRRVEALAVTAPAHYAVLLDGARRPLARVLLSSDARPAGVAARLRAELGSRYLDMTGVALTAGWTLPQLRWRVEDDPGLAARIRTVLIAKDWIRSELTGVDATDPSDAAGTGMYDLRAGTWAPDLVEAAGIRSDCLAPIEPATSVGGTLQAGWARRLGLTSGIPVAICATDTAAELISVGAVGPGDAIVKVASTGTVVTVTDVPKPDPRLLTYPHALPGRFYGMAATSTAATSDVWFRDAILATEGPTRGQGLDREAAHRSAARIPVGSSGLLFLPYLEGERSPYWDPALRGAFLGLTSAHTRGHLHRAVLEGVALSLRDCRDAMVDAGLAIADPVLAGGGLRSPLWRRIVVDCLGIPARTLAIQGPSIGAAMLAGASVGRPIPWVASGRRRPGRRIGPVAANVRAYDHLYGIYRDAVAASTEVSHQLARVQAAGSEAELEARSPRRDPG